MHIKALRLSKVKNFLAKREETKKFFDNLKILFDFLMPMFKREGRLFLNIGIGCTGGKHRSVYIAERLRSIIKRKGFDVKVLHRDIDKE